ncbi:MAG: ATP-binding protein [Candidatus Onthovivens sp.]|nr:ATP-binding protein [Candidatus Onthovivens sp.]
MKQNEKKQNVSLYKCNLCRDTGWILVHRDNAADLAVSCECRERKILKDQWKEAGINVENRELTFQTYTVWNEWSRIAKDTAIAYLNDFEEIKKKRKNSIILCGQVGSGKTHLAIALAINLINSNIQVVYMPYRDILTKIKQNMLDEEYYNKLLSKYKTCEVLLIDDLYKGKVTETDINIIFEIINYRYLNYLPIIVSSEYIIENLLRFDEAIGSRIYEMCKNYIIEIDKNIKNNYRLRGE